MSWKRCTSTHRGLRCSRRAFHFGVHHGRSRIGGNHWQWTTDPRGTDRRKRPHPGPTIAKRNAAKKRRAAKQERRAAHA